MFQKYENYSLIPLQKLEFKFELSITELSSHEAHPCLHFLPGFEPPASCLSKFDVQIKSIENARMTKFCNILDRQ